MTCPLRLTVPLAFLLVLFGCGKEEAAPDTTTEPAQIASVLASTPVPKDWPGAWSSSSSGVQHIVMGERVGLLFERGDAVGHFEAPLPAAAAGARRISVEAMSDGPFTLEVTVGGATHEIEGRDTRRQSTPFVAVFASPLDGTAKELRLRHVTSAHPVLVERVQFGN